MDAGHDARSYSGHPPWGCLLAGLLLVGPQVAKAADPPLDLERLSVAELQQKMAAGQLTSVQLTRAYINRIAAVTAGETARFVRRAAMKPAAFDYIRAEHLDEALDVLGQEGGDARIIAGGQSLMAMLNMRLAKPRTLIDIMRLSELARIESKGG